MTADSPLESRCAHDIAAVIVTYNSASTIRACVNALRGAMVDLEGEIVVVDNASADGTAALVREEFPDVRLVASADNRGFAAGCNLGIRATRARKVVLVNPDAEVEPDAIRALVEFLDSEPSAGLAGCTHVDEGGRFYLSCHPPMSVATVAWTHFQIVRLLPGLVHGRFLRAARDPGHKPFQVGWAMGSCLMAKRQVLDAIGMLDEGYFLYAEEADLCERARRAGWTVWFVPPARVRHAGGKSTEQVPFVRLSNYYVSKVRYFAKHGSTASAISVRLILAVDLAARLAIRSIQAAFGNRRAQERLVMYWQIMRKVLGR